MNIDFDIFRLDNGLKVLVHEDPRVATAAVDIIYRVGARDERAERTGLAHLFEHLMFSGSRNIPDYDSRVQGMGGQCNAFTNNDMTNYYLTCPANQLETAFWLESDRMLELDFSQRNLDVQISVVIEEFKQRYLNQPYGDAQRYLRPMIFKTHPYQWMTIGKEISHIEDVTLDVIRDFFYAHYAPNNATMVVAGGVKKDEVKRLAEKWFGPIPRRNVPEKNYPKETPQSEKREETVRKNVPAAAIYRAYRIPGRTNKAYYAADMITDLLSHGKSSRLYQRLVREQKLASRASAYSWGLFDEGAISIEARLAPGVTTEQFDAALDELLAELPATLEAEELERMQNKIEALETFEKAANLNRALHLAIFDYLGDPDLVNTSHQHYRKLTTDDMNAAFAQYLRPENSSTLYYLPQS